MNVATVVEIARRVLMDQGLGSCSHVEDANGYDSLTKVQFVLELERASGAKLCNNNELEESMTLEQVATLFVCEK